MKFIFTSQRIDRIEGYNEIRDSLDERWGTLLLECGFNILPVPNNKDILLKMMKHIEASGVLLTGGSNLFKYGGVWKNRDEVDRVLLDFAIENKLPLLGVCRGMQSIVDYFGGTLREIKSHVSIRHKIQGQINRNVNSYHGMAIDMLPPFLEPIALSLDGCVEAIKHREHKILGIMWHPERENPYSNEDIKLIKNFFDRGMLK